MSQETFVLAVRKGNSPTYGMTLLGTGPCVVADVTSSGPAARAGVKPGFVVLEIDGRNVVQKNHVEVREIIRDAEIKEWIKFKFATLESACHFFGNGLREMFEGNGAKKRSSSGSVKTASPRKSDGKGNVEALMKREETKENGGGGGGVGFTGATKSLVVDPIPRVDLKKPVTPPRTTKPIPQPRYGADVARKSHVQQNRDITRWMRTAEQQALNSPIIPSQPGVPTASPPSSSSVSVEFVCLYYSNLVDLLGGLEESVFRKNVLYLRNYHVPPQFWCRLVFSDKRLTVYRAEGKYATYSPKHMRDVFAHEDGGFFGFSTIRMSKVQGTSPTNTLESPQTMDVFSCHILSVDPTIRNSKSQREVLAQLIGRDRVMTKDSASVDMYFPEDALKVVEYLENFAIKTDLVKEVKDVANLLSSNTIPPARPIDDVQTEVEDVTASFNSASGLRNSMRKYGPYGNLLQQRNSISIDSLNTLPKRVVIPNGHPNRYSCIIGGSAMDRPPSSVPATIGENEVLKTVSQTNTGTYDSLSSFEHDSGWTRDVASCLDLTAHTSTGVSFDEQRGFPEPIYPMEKTDTTKLDLYQIMDNPKSLNLFKAFLRQEHSEENINFWLECQEYRTVKKSKEMKHAAKKMFDRFLAPHAPECINIDSHVLSSIHRSLHIPTTYIFDTASQQIFDLMNSDSFPRFLRSPYYLQLRQLLDPNPYNINQSMPFLNQPDSDHVPKARRESQLFSWFTKKKPELDLDSSLSSRISRQSLPVNCNNSSPSTNSRVDSISSPKNPILKLIDKGRKSFSARVKPSKRESLMTFLSDSEVRGEVPDIDHRIASPLSFQFRKPITPPPAKPDVVMRRPKAPRSAGKDQKRLSLQGLHRAKTSGITEPTEWTFSRSSLDDCLDKPPVPPKPCELISARHAKKSSQTDRPASQLRTVDF